MKSHGVYSLFSNDSTQYMYLLKLSVGLGMIETQRFSFCGFDEVSLTVSQYSLMFFGADGIVRVICAMRFLQVTYMTRSFSIWVLMLAWKLGPILVSSRRQGGIT